MTGDDRPAFWEEQAWVRNRIEHAQVNDYEVKVWEVQGVIYRAMAWKTDHVVDLDMDTRTERNATLGQKAYLIASLIDA